MIWDLNCWKEKEEIEGKELQIRRLMSKRAEREETAGPCLTKTGDGGVRYKGVQRGREGGREEKEREKRREVRIGS